MYIRGALTRLDTIARELIIYGFEYAELRNIIEENFRGLNLKQYDYLEDNLYSKIEKFANYITIEDYKTGEKYYYMTIKDIQEDTGMTLSSINGSIYGGHKANSRYIIEREEFKTKDINKNKEDMFNKRIGKVLTREYHTKSGKHLRNPIKVTDTHTGLTQIYKTGRSFCNKFKMPTYNLSRYINDGFRYKSRYLIEKVSND